jgi:hypothetical protein
MAMDSALILSLAILLSSAAIVIGLPIGVALAFKRSGRLSKLRLSTRITAGIAIAVALLLGVIYVMAVSSDTNAPEVSAVIFLMLLTWPLIMGGLIVAGIIALVSRKRR